ncbi:hypothetical protein GQ54DRAFT_314797 [Martensiomyces pterosporus]|nr:hypothetical protein GQ54DRAFT_314797 [Martensiomyces pterosporus]
MRFSSFALLTLPVAMADTYVRDIGATKDATIVYSTAQCGDTPCALVNYGMDNTLTASQQNGDAVRIILGFALPDGYDDPNAITSCELQLQRPVFAPDSQYTLTATEASDNWDEATVNGLTNIPSGKTLGSVLVTGNERPNTIDVTDACKDAVANGGAFSIWVDSDGLAVTFPSMQTGAASTVRVFT